MMNLICIKEYKGIGYLRENTDKNKKVLINIGDKIDCDKQGYLWKDNVCFWHKDAAPSMYFTSVAE